MKIKEKVHRAWLLLACSCLLAAPLGTITLLSVFTLPVSTALEVPRAAFTLYTSIMSLMPLVSMPFWGRMLPRIGIRATVAISGAGAGLAFIAMSYFTSLWQFYVAGIVIGLTLPGCSLLSVSVIITNWFEHRRGMAMGIAVAFTGLYSAIASTFIPGMIMTAGWESAYLFLGIAVLALTIPTIPFLHSQPAVGDGPETLCQRRRNRVSRTARYACRYRCRGSLPVDTVLAHLCGNVFRECGHHRIHAARPSSPGKQRHQPGRSRNIHQPVHALHDRCQNTPRLAG